MLLNVCTYGFWHGMAGETGEVARRPHILVNACTVDTRLSHSDLGHWRPKETRKTCEAPLTATTRLSASGDTFSNLNLVVYFCEFFLCALTAVILFRALTVTSTGFYCYTLTVNTTTSRSFSPMYCTAIRVFRLGEYFCTGCAFVVLTLVLDGRV